MPEKEPGSIQLYDLSVEVRHKGGQPFACSHVEGEAFRVVGENLVFDQPTTFSLYAMAAILPLLPAKQRTQLEGDWIAEETDVACPDSACGAIFRIRRAGKTRFPREVPNPQ